MQDETTPLTLTLHNQISDIDPADWNVCAGADNPFVSHAFFLALEESGSTGPGTGWLPQHMALSDKAGQVMAVAPIYAKLHSYGEYVFDQSWAEAFENAGGSYYPKLQICVPFSPVPGVRLLSRPGSQITTAMMGDALIQLCKKFSMSSVHVSFCTENEWTDLGKAGWLQRLGMQFHWHNNGYADFEGFLSTLSSRHRKSIKRERRDANACGLVFHTLCGADIKSYHWDSFYRFYQETVDRKWGTAYLTRDFFTYLSRNLSDKIVLMMAEHNGVWVAGALNLLGADTLYGRNWGCSGSWPFLHFELCYYRAIDFAIVRGLKHVEAGAQGDHKIQRGYLPEFTYSAHWIAHEKFSHVVDDFLKRERTVIQIQKEGLAAYAPFKQNDKSVPFT